jgi:succinate dehydrogenase flavin-adding protein (antitoxin of CptAB toxin-antitoxin module)
MHSEPEIREDMEKLRDHVKALADKYGDEFSCILSAGVDMGKAWAGSSLVYGESYLVYQACRGLLEMPKFIDEFFDAVKDVLSSKELPDFLKEMTRESVESMKRMLIVETKAYKKFTAEKEVDEAVQDLLKKAGFAN